MSNLQPTMALLALLAASPAQAKGGPAIQAPARPMGSAWLYSDGQDTMRETQTAAGAPYQRPRQLLKFPFRVGSTWKDQVRCQGSGSRPGLDYRYDYQEEAVSEVKALETVETGAGRFQAYRIERMSYWTKSNASSAQFTFSDPPEQRAQSGFSKELYWYAPAVGRMVLRARTQRGQKSLDWWDQTPRDFLSGAAVEIVELVAFAGPGQPLAPGRVRQARPCQAPFPGFETVLNNSMRFLFQTEMF